MKKSRFTGEQIAFALPNVRAPLLGAYQSHAPWAWLITPSRTDQIYVSARC